MSSATVNTKVQQALLYSLTALALLASVYLLRTGLRDLETVTASILSFVPVATALILLFSSIYTFFNAEFARRLALITASAVGLLYLFQICATLPWAPVLVFSPRPFVTMLLPGLLLWLTIRYSHHIGTVEHRDLTVWRWLWYSDSTTVLSKGALVGTVLLMFAFIGREVTVSDKTATYQMTWDTSADRHCSHRVTLTFENAPAYHMDICSRSLRDHLQSNATDTINMQLHADYVWGTWEYTVEYVDSWPASEEVVPRIFASCFSRDPECEESEFPLSGPYSFR